MSGEQTCVEGIGRIQADEGGVGCKCHMRIGRLRARSEKCSVDDFVVKTNKLAGETPRGERIEEDILVRVDRNDGRY